MTKPRTHGIDLIIPVLLADKKLEERGPLFGPWTEEQYEAAGAVLAYIVIDAKNWNVVNDANGNSAQSRQVPAYGR
jgi:hypothetical protein